MDASSILSRGRNSHRSSLPACPPDASLQLPEARRGACGGARRSSEAVWSPLAGSSSCDNRSLGTEVDDQAVRQFCVIAFSQKREIVVLAKTHFPGFVEIRFSLFPFWLQHPNKVLVCYTVILVYGKLVLPKRRIQTTPTCIPQHMRKLIHCTSRQS